MNKLHHAHVIDSAGKISHLGYVAMERGCPQTRNFAISSNRDVPNGGVSFVVGADATPEAVAKAVNILKSYFNH
jgi:hypothetical protein